jgi:hypothetical protein
MALPTPDPLQLNNTLNFNLPSSWLSGCIDLSIAVINPGGGENPRRLANNGLVWKGIMFKPARTLNLVLAPYIYRNGLRADIGATQSGSLLYLNDVYPLPDGSTGINIVGRLPPRSTNRNMDDVDGKSDFLDDLSGIYADLQGQGGLPSDWHLLGMVPCGCGGMAELPGRVAFGDTWAAGSDPPAQKFEYYGATWAQEIAHNFGRLHVSTAHREEPPTDAAYDTLRIPHGGIGGYGLAINTESWNRNGLPYYIIPPGNPGPNGQNPHAHDFMSYGGTIPSQNTNQWVSSYTFNGLFRDMNPNSGSLSDQTFARQTSAIEQLVAVGHVNADGQVKLQPFYRISTDAVSSPGDNGEFSLELLDANGVVLVTYRFNGHQRTHGDGVVGFAEFVPWQAGTQRIVLKRNEVTLTERLVSPNTPTVRVLSPNGGEILGHEVTITWEASDADGDPLTYTVLYNTGTEAIWWPVASGVTDTSIQIDTALLPGSSQARFRVRVTDGVNTAEDDSDNVFTVSQKAPEVTILHPSAEQHIAAGADVDLQGGAYDAEDGLLSLEQLTWTSHRDGVVGHGHHVHTTALSPGTHILTLAATDSQGQVSTAQVNVVVEESMRFLYLPVIMR